MSQRLTVRQATAARQVLMFGANADDGTGDVKGRSRRLSPDVLRQLSLDTATKRIVLVIFKAAWCPVSLARVQHLARKLAGAPFVLAAVTLGGSSDDLQELRRNLPEACQLLVDRNLLAADTLGVYAGKGLLRPGIAIVDLDGNVDWLHAAEARTDDWQRLRGALAA